MPASYRNYAPYTFSYRSGGVWYDSPRTFLSSERIWTGVQRAPRPRFYWMGVFPVNASSTRENGSIYTDTGAPLIVRGIAKDMPGTVRIERSEATTQERNQMKFDARSRFNASTGLGETLLESAESYLMVSRRVKTALDVLRLTLKGNYKQAAKLLNETTGSNISSKNWKPRPVKSLGDVPSSIWLELQLGWQPLIQSIHDSVHKLNETTKQRKSTSARNGNIVTTEKARVKAGVVATVSNTNTQKLNELGLLNPALLAWNKVPYSFIIDWFLPIGAILQTLSMHFGYSAIVGWESAETLNITYRDNPRLGALEIGRTTGYVRMQWFPLWPVLTIRNSLNFGKTLTGLALIQQLRK